MAKDFGFDDGRRRGMRGEEGLVRRVWEGRRAGVRRSRMSRGESCLVTG